MEIRLDLMDCEFPSIWIELKNVNQKPTLVAGYFIEWTWNGDNSEKAQMERMDNFAAQIEKANEKSCNIVILGDANLCSEKWNEDTYYLLTYCGQTTYIVGSLSIPMVVLG